LSDRDLKQLQALAGKVLSKVGMVLTPFQVALCAV